MNTRIRELRKSLGLSQEEFGARIGVKRSTITNYETGDRVPIDAIVASICREFGVSAEWLETGEGDPYMKRDDSYSLVEEIRDITKNEHPLMAAVMASLAEMPPEWWNEWSKRLHEEVDRVNKKKEGS